MSLREYDLITRAKINAKNAEFKAWRVLNQELGILVKYAYHRPQNMPDLTKVGEQKSGALTGKAATKRLHQFLLGQALNSKQVEK